jgi:hypothetical protein
MQTILSFIYSPDMCHYTNKPLYTTNYESYLKTSSQLLHLFNRFLTFAIAQEIEEERFDRGSEVEVCQKTGA